MKNPDNQELSAAFHAKSLQNLVSILQFQIEQSFNPRPRYRWIRAVAKAGR